ncbi:sulfurtransferase [Gluconacetobacter azotocaptans]|uniref:sulfurtransferase n=1 Tax=Gluconacetobacter azotocaptans TaxID=142834 RepID=UPI001958857E|nr:sulfurtransferase [Gluconacetobacter azotocaptans]MBM9402764.1 sulfurtransferase [Gluconacetobacter azotocaptans]
MSLLIEAEELVARIGRPGLVILDATSVLPGQSFDPDENFRARRIVGARRFDIECFSDPDTTLPHMVPGQGRFGRLFGALGVETSSEVVFYDQTGVASACRGWWLADLFGHANIRVLNGGLPAWSRVDGPVESGPAAAPVSKTYHARPRYTRLKGLGDVLSLLGTSDAVILDARSKARFAGTAKEPRPGVRSGHIPGSRNVPFGELLDAENRFLSAPDIRARLEQEGVDGGRPVITTCGSGLTACVLAAALVVAGFPRGAVYDGSWAEWGSLPDLPIATL